MRSETSLASTPAPSRATKPSTSSDSAMLTNSELEQLRRVKKEQSVQARAAIRRHLAKPK